MRRDVVFAEVASKCDQVRVGERASAHDDDQMIEAPHTGAWVHETTVYGGDFAGIRRVLPTEAQVDTPSSASTS